MEKNIIIKGAKENNLQNLDLTIPRDKMIVFTGLSGSGKSSLAFDTIYAEGQKKYMESLSSYARQFLGMMKKPDVESIEGLSPAISIDQKTTSKNPRSTVGTVTEIYDYLRLIYARIGIPHCPICGREISSQSVDTIVEKINSEKDGTRVIIMAPVVRGRKGEHKNVISRIRRDGYMRVRIDGRNVLIGNEKLMKEKAIFYEPCKNIGTVVYVAREGKFLGSIVIADTVKDGAKEAIASMKKVGVKKCVMLTGDRKEAAEGIVAELGIDEVHAELLPQDKVSQVERLLKEENGKEKLAFVGDGINDAPVLTRADIGIAMGSMGSDAAIEAADVVLMDDDIRKIASIVRISRKTLGIVKQNIVFALAVKAIVLVLGAFGVANMWEAVFADVGVSVIAILNSMRALKTE